MEHRAWFKKQIVQRLLILAAVMAIVSVFGATGLFAESETQEVQKAAATAEVQKFGLIAAAIAFGLGAIGAGIAISNVGAAAMGAIGEKPEIAGQALIFIALAEGLVVFGFITALMILGKI
ncbi:MAG: ATPase [Spirochaetales bacterium]|nr:ATPase [Spirochaetales bacterium]